MLLVETENLRKEFGPKIAVKNLTLQVMAGEVFGYLGPNGAGKTTSIKMLMSLIFPTSGTAQLLGKPLGDREVRRKIGFLPEHFRFHDWLTADEFLNFHGRLYGMKQPELRNRIDEVLSLVGLPDRKKDRLRTFSKGMLQRIGLAQAIINRPHIVFLDEPTSGLDPLGRREFRDIVRKLRDEGVTVFLNSHILSEVEMVCDRVAIIDKGVVVESGPLAVLLEGDLQVEIRVDRIDPELIQSVSPFCKSISTNGSVINVTVEDKENIPLIARAIVSKGISLYSLQSKQDNLEDLFVRLVERGEG